MGTHGSGRSGAAVKKKAPVARKSAPQRAAGAYKFDAAAETMPRAEIERLQLRRLKTSIKNAYDNVPFHRRRLKAIGFEPGDLKRLDDLAGLPFTLKTDLRDHYPLACSRVRAPSWFGCMPHRGPPASRPWWATPRRISPPGPI
jgi:hypothetical protein